MHTLQSFTLLIPAEHFLSEPAAVFCVAWLRDLAQSLAIMDIDIISAPPLKCFICEDSETPARKLLQVIPKGYRTLLAYAEAIGDATVQSA